MAISIHAPREGSDGPDEILAVVYAISIHAPREGSDASDVSKNGPFLHFNPRSPRGERRMCFLMALPSSNFNPRSPRGERHP